MIIDDHDALKQIEQAHRERDEARDEVRRLRQWGLEATEGLQKWKSECDSVRQQLATARAEYSELFELNRTNFAARLELHEALKAKLAAVPVLPVDDAAERRIEALLAAKPTPAATCAKCGARLLDFQECDCGGRR